MLRRQVSILLPNLRGGGAERISVNLANALVQRGYCVEMVLMSAVGDFMGDLSPEIGIVDLKTPRMRNLIFALVRYFRQTDAATLLACMWPLTAAALCARMLARAKTRVVVAEHCTWSHNIKNASSLMRWIVRGTMRISFPRADGVVTVSGGAADDLAVFAGLKRKNIAVIYNPVVAKSRCRALSGPMVPYEWWRGSHKRILAVGMLKPEKDYATLLKAFAILRRTANVRLLIWGDDGGCRSALETQARMLGIESSLFMPGFVKDPTPYYKRAHLHVLTSVNEGLPTVLIEALAAGTPVVSTDCPSGPREILCDGQFGRITPVGNAAAIASAMRDSLNAYHDKAALVARAQDFNVAKAVDHYEALLFPQLSANE